MVFTNQLTGQVLGFGLSNGSGQVTATLSSLPAGNTVVAATVSSTTTACNCTAVVGTTTVTVSQPTVTCTVTASSAPANPAVGDTVTVTARVTCAGAGLSGATVQFTNQATGAVLGSGTTDATGTASFTTATLPAGSTTIVATANGSSSTCTCNSGVGVVTVTVGGAPGVFTALPACYRLNFPPLPWAFANATFTATGAAPGTLVTFHLDGAGGPVVCTAAADATGTATCTGNLSVFQLVNTTYTATATISGSQVSSSSTLLPCA